MDNCVKIITLLMLLCFGMGVRADNTVMITGGSGAPIEEVTVTVSMANTDAVWALQLSIPLDEDLKYVANSATATERLANLALSAGVKEGTLNIMVYSVSTAAIAAGEGDLLTFRLKLGDTPTDISLTPSKLTLTGTSGQTLSGSSVSGTVSICCAKAQYSTMTVDFGEVPIRSTYQQTVTVSNVGNEPLTVTALNFSDPMVFSSSTALPFVVAAGGSKQIDVTYAPTERGTIQKTLTVTCNSISKLNTIKLTAQPFAVNELHVGNASGVSDTEVEVALTMNNMDDVIGFQVEFQLPEALKYVDGSFTLNANRKQDHVAGVVTQDRLLRIIAYSPSGKALTGNNGAIGSFRVKLVGRYGVTLTPTKAILTAQINGVTTNVLSAQYSGTISIQSPQLSGNSTLAFGRMPVTGDVQKTYTIRNYGSAPLTISRIAFLDEGYSVKETLPMTINIGSSKSITVVRTDKTEGDFATTMQIYSNDPELRMKSVGISGNIFAPNYLNLSVDKAYTTGQLTLHVATDNYDALEGIQFEVKATDGFTTNDAATVVSARGTGLVVTTRRVDDETLRVVAYMMGGHIGSGNGEVFSVQLNAANGLSQGQHQLQVTNIKLGTGGMQDKYAGVATQTVSYSVDKVVLGDVNGDGMVDMTDAISIVYHYLGETPTGFITQFADMNGDGLVDMSDAISVVYQYLAPASGAEDQHNPQ